MWSEISVLILYTGVLFGVCKRFAGRVSRVGCDALLGLGSYV